HEVDDLVVGPALVDGETVRDQRRADQVRLPQPAQGLDGPGDVVQQDPGVGQPLEDPDLEDVPERVEPAGPGARGATDAGHNDALPGPVVQLAVGHTGEPLDLAVAVHGVIGDRCRVGGKVRGD